MEETKKKIQNYWNSMGEYFDKRPGDRTEEQRNAWKQFFLEKLGKKPLKILDVGTGTGFLSISVAEIGHEVMGIDISEGMLSQARKKAERRGLNLDLKIDDAESLSLEDETFNIVVSNAVLWSLPNPEKAVREWKRVLKPGGSAYAFASDMAGQRGIYRQIKRALGDFMVWMTDEKNYWGGLDRSVQKKLPLHWSNQPDSRVSSIVKFYERCGFDDISVTEMKEISTIRAEERKRRPLRYRIGRNSSHTSYCCVSGFKLGK